MSKSLTPAPTLEDPDLLARARALRSKGGSPKTIDRALGLRPADAAHLVRELATEAGADVSQPELSVAG